MPVARGSPRGNWVGRLEPLAYGLVAGVITLLVATQFYGSLRLQTLHALHWARPSHFDSLIAQRTLGPWSAPLDDVFIHFDFARAAARGFPFEWSEGNGYSSGGTSLLYPFVLALGYWAGFRELSLMEWAAVVACVSTFAVLLAARRFASELPRAASYLLPFGFLAVGALDWSLFSGMEVALFLALWSAAYLAYENVGLRRHEGRGALRAAALLGGTAALVTATRPEGIVAVFVLAVAAALPSWKSNRVQSAAIAAIAIAPGLCVLVAQALANRLLTGQSSAAGALVKLEIHHPYLSGAQVLEAWWFHVKYQVLRVTQYHFGDQPAYGWLVWALGLSALAYRRTRRPAIVLWASAVSWTFIVALNGQVRWQNERYSMPAVAWLLLAASLGTGALLTHAVELRHKIRGPVMLAAVLASVALFVDHQLPRFREQVWFFGRAARNILDQHVRVGMTLRFETSPTPSRVLIGDAGAIPYVSDLPALDIIGLGGYHQLPFAAATRQHVGAALELIERIAPPERPDLLAIYPGWWGELPLWFGTKIEDFPVRGNVICAGPSKVLYRPDWTPLDPSARPAELVEGERVVAALDPADVLSERQRGYRIEHAPGFVVMKILEAPKSRRPLWDAGRVVPPGASERFVLDGIDPGRRLRLIIRAAPTQATSFDVTLDGLAAGRVALEPADGWVEVALDHLNARGSQVEIRFGPSERERIAYHVFAVQSR